ncbi:alanine/glycine:cation symporter family protein [Pseudopedobacter beijingensis]|uniref:Alanine/glycine:cation symporter family protein n=1 Tax=Pseudopedobacter beijingensis TaxID=1207056 RepID=A0ABW4IDD9_9SPHI
MHIIKFLNDIIWSNVFLILCIGAGLYFSFVTKFLQVRYIKDMVTLLFKESSDSKGVSPFQAFSIAIAGRVGTGNIAGVATAIAMGGPGAVFWMWMIAFFGAATAFIEATLGQIYKIEKEGQYKGGPAYYIERGLGVKWYALLFAIATMISCTLFLPGVQSNSIADSMNNAFNIPPYVTGISVAALLAVIIFGGVQRIARVSEVIVSFMAGAYILMAVVILFLNLNEIPEIFSLIVKSAFGIDATFGGIIGMAVSWGIKRGIYSNEAGQGTAPHAAAAAATSHPVKQGLVQAFSVYIDTLFVCSSTAFIILFTGKYNVKNPAGGFLLEQLPGIEEGPAFTQAAVASHFPSIGNEFIAFALLFFAFTTAIAYYFIAESNLHYLHGNNPTSKLKINILRIVFLVSVYFGCISKGGDAWMIGDIGVGIMAWLNIVAIILLQKPALKAFKDYESQKRAGKNPTFDPEKLNIRNTIWKKD